MSKIKKIMIACDLSKYSKETLAYAASLAEELKAELIIVNVINQRDVDTILKVAERQFDRSIEEYIQKSADDYVKTITEDRTRQLDKLIEELSFTHIPVRKVFKKGVPFEKIIEAVETEEADMLVMGQKGRSDLTGVLFGSVAEKVFRRCPVPLLSIRAK